MGRAGLRHIEVRPALETQAQSQACPLSQQGLAEPGFFQIFSLHRLNYVRSLYGLGHAGLWASFYLIHVWPNY